jgi:Tol biopolymer transport system component
MKWDVYLMNVSGGAPRRITSDSAGYVQGAEISPDGSKITYDRASSSGSPYGEICVVSSLGGASRKIAEGWLPGWGGDATRLAYVWRSRQTTKYELRSVNIEGNDPRIELIDTISVYGGRISWDYSPDGKCLVWLRFFPGNYEEIIIHERDTGRERQITFDKKRIDEVIWTTNDMIIFSSNRGGHTNLWMIPSKGGMPVQLTRGTGPDTNPRVSFDGNRLLYYQLQQIGQIWRARLDGAAAHQLTSYEAYRSWPSFSPDGMQIVFSMKDPDLLLLTTHLFMVDREGGDFRQLTSGDEYSYAPLISPDGKWIAYLSRTTSEPADSTRLCLIDALGQGARRMLGKGRTYCWWVDTVTLLRFDGSQSWLHYLDGREPEKFFKDSTFTVPILNRQYVLYFDNHRGKESWWVASLGAGSDKREAEPRRLVYASPGISRSGRFFVYANRRQELWRVSLPDGKETRIHGQFPGLRFGNIPSLSYDDKELVYIDSRVEGKLVLIENPFE